MPLTESIKGGVPQVSTQPQKPGYYPSRHTAEMRHLSLRPGEIIQGRIITLLPENKVEVRLPNGTFTAELTGKLKAGDILFFRVQASNPDLILKIYAVTTKLNGEIMPDEELLRMLNFTSTHLNTELIRYLKKRKNFISRDDVLLILKNLESIDESQLKCLSSTDIFNVLLFISESKIQPDDALFRRIKYVLSGPQMLQKALTQLEASLPAIPQTEATQLRYLFNEIKSAGTKLYRRIEIFNYHVSSGKQINTLYVILNVLNEKLSSSKWDSKILGNIQNIMDAIEGQYYINSYSSTHSLPLYFFVPYFVNKRLNLIQLKTGKKTHKQQSNNVKFTLFFSTSSLGEVKAEGNYINESLLVDIFAEDDTGKKLLDENKKNLLTNLKKRGYLVSSVKVGDQQDFLNQESSIDQSGGFSRFSVVV
jgi:hypothetical protein